MGSIQAVLFDLDGTLLHTDPSSMEMFYRAVAARGVDLSIQQQRAGKRWAHWYWAESADLHADLEEFGGSYDNAAFWNHHAWRHLTSMGIEDQLARKLGGEITHELRQQGQPHEFVPGEALEAIANLRSQGVLLGLVSNRRNPLHEVAERLGVREQFDLLLAAGEVGHWKPNPGLLQAAVDRLAVDPAQSIYVGDNFFADVVAAEAAGMKAVLYDPEGLFEEAQCPVIDRIDQVLDYLAPTTAW